MNTTKKYYAAYGTNMNLKEMELRCPTAKMVGVGKIIGSQLQFNVYANIVKGNKNNVVPVVVWEIDSKCEDSLDNYEGVPYLYHKDYINVIINDEEIISMVYVINDDVKPQLPTSKYFHRVKKGYIDHGLDMKYLYNAVMLTLYKMV